MSNDEARLVYHIYKGQLDEQAQRSSLLIDPLPDRCTPGGGKTYSTCKILVESCIQNPNFIGFLAQNTKGRIDGESEKIRTEFGLVVY